MNCADISNSLVPRGTKVSAIDVKAKTFFQRLYLVPGLRKIAPFVTMLCDYFSISVQFVPQMAPQFFFKHDSPSNLAESRYPPK